MRPRSSGRPCPPDGGIPQSAAFAKRRRMACPPTPFGDTLARQVTDLETPPAAAATRSTIDWPGWAVYLGSSWTWCIGMFLPVLLVRDYGIWSFVAFAAPNVIGAAAMGWVMRSGAHSRRFLQDHRVAVPTFSIVTILFQAFFIGWLCRAGGNSVPVIGGAFGGLLILMLLLLRAGYGMERWLALLAALVSWAMGVIVLKYRLNLGLHWPAGRDGTPVELAALAAACGLGFLLCPYLDRTFHFARGQLSPAGAKAAFGVGFGVVFFSMILFTLAYSDLIGFGHLRDAILAAIIIHLIVQTAFTAAAHAALVQSWVAVLAVVAATAAAFFFAAVGPSIAWLPAGEEFGYRAFMAFYGLIAPAYVWLCAIPFRAGRPTRRQGIALVVAIVAAAPFYWMAFIERQMPWAAGGVAIVLLAKVLAPRR